MTIKAPMMPCRLSHLLISKSCKLSHTFTPTLDRLQKLQIERKKRNREMDRERCLELRMKTQSNTLQTSPLYPPCEVGCTSRERSGCKKEKKKALGWVLNLMRTLCSLPPFPCFFPLWSESLPADLCSANATLYQLSIRSTRALGEKASNGHCYWHSSLGKRERGQARAADSRFPYELLCFHHVSCCGRWEKSSWLWDPECVRRELKASPGSSLGKYLNYLQAITGEPFHQHINDRTGALLCSRMLFNPPTAADVHLWTLENRNKTLWMSQILVPCNHHTPSLPPPLPLFFHVTTTNVGLLYWDCIWKVWPTHVFSYLSQYFHTVNSFSHIETQIFAHYSSAKQFKFSQIHQM